MTYWQTAELVEEANWRQRVFGVAVTESNPMPEQWAYANRAQMITPEMIGAYDSALAGGMTSADAAKDPAVITEGMILSRYQYLLAPPGQQ